MLILYGLLSGVVSFYNIVFFPFRSHEIEIFRIFLVVAC